jgi:hypothetical protein
MAKMTK